MTKMTTIKLITKGEEHNKDDRKQNYNKDNQNQDNHKKTAIKDNHRATNRKSFKFFLIFCVPEGTKLTWMLFFEGIGLSDFFFVLLH